MEVNADKILLLAEDNDDHYLLTEEAFAEAKLPFVLRRVRDGEELMEYLLKRGSYSTLNSQNIPSLILLDLNMPRKDGREALKEIKSYPEFRKIPVIILTTSKNEEDVVYADELGVTSFIRKPVDYQEFVEFMKKLLAY